MGSSRPDLDLADAVYEILIMLNMNDSEQNICAMQNHAHWVLGRSLIHQNYTEAFY